MIVALPLFFFFVVAVWEAVRGRLPLFIVLQRHAGLEAHHELFDPRHCRFEANAFGC